MTIPKPLIECIKFAVIAYAIMVFAFIVQTLIENPFWQKIVGLSLIPFSLLAWVFIEIWRKRTYFFLNWKKWNERNFISLNPDEIYFRHDWDFRWFDGGDRYWILHPSFLDNDPKDVIIGSVYLRSYPNPSHSYFIFEDNTCVIRTPECDGYNLRMLTYVNARNFLPFVHQGFLSQTSISITDVQAREIYDKSWTHEMDGKIIKIKMPIKIEKYVKNYFKQINIESLQNQKSIKYKKYKHLKFAFMDHMLRVGNVGYNPLKVDIKSIEYGTKMEEMGNAYIHASKHLIENDLIKRDDKFPFGYDLTDLGKNAHKYGLEEAIAFNRNENEKWWIWMIMTATLAVSTIGAAAAILAITR